MDVRDYANGQRLGHFLGERLGSVLTSRDIGETVAGLMSSKFGVMIAVRLVLRLGVVVLRSHRSHHYDMHGDGYMPTPS